MIDHADAEQVRIAITSDWWREEALIEAIFCDYPQRRSFKGWQRAIRKLARALREELR